MVLCLDGFGEDGAAVASVSGCQNQPADAKAESREDCCCGKHLRVPVVGRTWLTGCTLPMRERAVNRFLIFFGNIFVPPSISRSGVYDGATNHHKGNATDEPD